MTVLREMREEGLSRRYVEGELVIGVLSSLKDDNLCVQTQVAEVGESTSP